MKVILICIDCEGEKEEIIRLVNIVKSERIDVTFFVTGQTIERYPDLFKGLAKEFQIESHTYAHVNLRKLSKEQQRDEILKGKKAVEKVIGRETNGFKAPMHCLNKDTVEILNELNFRFDTSSLYFQYNLGRTIKLKPSWFREWCGFYSFLGINASIPWMIFKLLFHLKKVLLISIHPHYSGKNEEMAEAFRNFIKYIKRKNAQIMNIEEYLQIIIQ